MVTKGYIRIIRVTVLSESPFHVQNQPFFSSLMSLVTGGYHVLLRILYRRKETYIVIVLPFCHRLQEVLNWLLTVTPLTCYTLLL